MKLNNRWRKEGAAGHITHKVTTDETVPTAGCLSSALQTHSQLFLNKPFYIIKLYNRDDKILLRGQEKKTKQNKHNITDILETKDQ